MALQITIYVSGKIGNIVFYQRGDAYIARAIPDRVKQSAATQIRSKNFGVAASTGKILRNLLQPVISFPKDKKIQSRFSGAIARWLGLSDYQRLPSREEIPFVTNFSFNPGTAVSERCRLKFTITQSGPNLLQLDIPSFVPTAAFVAPAHTVTVECTVVTACCNIINPAEQSSNTQTFTVSYNNEMTDTRSLLSAVFTNNGSLVVTVLSISFILAGGNKDLRPVYLPASVINARC
jgi:hypothetical protein